VQARVSHGCDPSPKALTSYSIHFLLFEIFIHSLRLNPSVLQALPVVGVMVLLRLGVWFYGGLGGWVDPGVALSFVGISIFVTSFLLQAVMRDYREAERIPCTIAVALEGILATVRGGCAAEQFGEDGQDGRRSRYAEAHGHLLKLFEAVVEELNVQDVSAAGVTSKSDTKYQEVIESLDRGCLRFGVDFDVFPCQCRC
jgi:hypothetical protein